MKKKILIILAVLAVVIIATIILKPSPKTEKITGKKIIDKSQTGQIIQITIDPGAQGYPGLATDGQNFYISYTNIPHNQAGEPIFEDFKVYLEKYDENWQLIKKIPNDKGKVTCDTNLSFHNTALHVAGSGPGESDHIDKYDLNLNHLESYVLPIEEKSGFQEKQCDPTLLITEKAIFVPYLNLERALRTRNVIQQFDLNWQPVRKVALREEQILSWAEIREFEESKRNARQETGEVTYLNVRTAPSMVKVNEEFYFLSNIGPGFNAYLVKLDNNFQVIKTIKLTDDNSKIFNTPRSLVYHDNHLYAFYTHQENQDNAHIYCQKLDPSLKLVAKYLLTNELGMQTYPQVIVKDNAFYMVYEHGPIEKEMINEKRNSDIFVKIWEEGL